MLLGHSLGTRQDHLLSLPGIRGSAAGKRQFVYRPAAEYVFVTDKFGLLERFRFCGSVARPGPGRWLTSRPLPARAAIIAEAIYGLLCVWDWVEGPQPAAAASVRSCRLQSPFLARSLARGPPSWRRAGTLV